jgi:hypothetical protein
MASPEQIPNIQGPRLPSEEARESDIDPEKFKRIIKVEKTDDSEKKKKKQPAEEELEEEAEAEGAQAGQAAAGFSNLMNEGGESDSIFDVGKAGGISRKARISDPEEQTQMWEGPRSSYGGKILGDDDGKEVSDALFEGLDSQGPTSAEDQAPPQPQIVTPTASTPPPPEASSSQQPPLPTAQVAGFMPQETSPQMALSEPESQPSLDTGQPSSQKNEPTKKEAAKSVGKEPNIEEFAKLPREKKVVEEELISEKETAATPTIKEEQIKAASNPFVEEKIQVAQMPPSITNTALKKEEPILHIIVDGIVTALLPHQKIPDGFFNLLKKKAEGTLSPQEAEKLQQMQIAMGFEPTALILPAPEELKLSEATANVSKPTIRAPDTPVIYTEKGEVLTQLIKSETSQDHSDHPHKDQSEEVIAPIAQVAPIIMTPTINPVEQPAYTRLRPDFYELFEKMVGIMTVELHKGVSVTTVKLDMPGSVFDKAEIILERYASAPNSFNLQLQGSEKAVNMFNSNITELAAAFQGARLSFEVNIRRPILLKREESVFHRKSTDYSDMDEPRE